MSVNDKITKKERGLIKGALRRVFSRSELRRGVLASQAIEHSDPKHPRVTRWAWCSSCGEVLPAYKMQVDHIQPVVDIDKTLEQMDWNELVDKLWCNRNNLTAMCISCHDTKSRIERKARNDAKKGKK